VIQFSNWQVYSDLVHGFYLSKPKLTGLVKTNQTHGTKIAVIKRPIKRLTQPADGLITNLTGVNLMIRTADCLPIMLFDPKRKVVGLIHAGWRGTIGKIFIKAVLLMLTEFGSKIKDIQVGIGPHIQSCCYQAETVIQQFLPEWQPYLNQGRIDLSGFVTDELEQVGILKENIKVIDQCTGCSSLWPSYFKGSQKQFYSVIGLKHA